MFKLNKWIFKAILYWKQYFFHTLNKTIHPRNTKKSKLHFNKSSISILSSNFVEAISNILDWHETKGNDEGNSEVEECKSFSQNVFFNKELNFMCINHVNKLIFAHLNINSLWNKLEFPMNSLEAKSIF